MLPAADAALLVLALTLAAALGARRLPAPLPVVLAIVGVALGVAWRHAPWLPPLHVPPERVLLVFLPPLLTTAAYGLPLGAARDNLRPIAWLAVGLVLATMALTAAVAHAAIGLPWAAAFVLGAIVAPPDPVAATAVAGQTGLAHRLVVILEGEGLINDAAAIVAYHVAVRAAAGDGFGWGHAALTLAREVPLGIGVGLAVGWVVTALRRRLDDVTLEAGISLFVPFLTYEIADRLGGSAVLAVVTLGFVLQRRAMEIGTPAVRLAARTVWGAMQFAGTALVFLLLGLLLGQVAGGGFTRQQFAAGAAVAGAAIALRMAWMYVVPYALRLARLVPPTQPVPSWPELTVLGWSGMRGVVSLALALALPGFAAAAGGAAARANVVLLAFAVIVATLGLQGLTLLPLVERLGAGDPGREARDEQRVRARARRAGLAALTREAHGHRIAVADCQALARGVTAGAVGIAQPRSAAVDPDHDARAGAAQAVLAAQRGVVDQARDGARVSTDLAERLATELDVAEVRLRGDSARLTGAGDG